MKTHWTASCARRIYVRENGEYVLRDQLYTEDRSAERKREAARGLCEGGPAAFLAMGGERVAGFTSLIWDAEETGVILPDLIRVDARYRRRGIGRRLFALALEEARRLGAREMRISANHAEETVRFYRAMGAEILRTRRPG